MSKYVNEVTKRILNITFEIIYLLTGEDYTIMKRTLSDRATPNSHLHGSGEWSRSQSPITEAPPHLPLHEQKIVELTNKITELLTGEVPIRCQDVAVYFSMEEWEYLEEQKDLYEDVMMGNHQPHKSQEKPIEDLDENFMSSLNYTAEDEDIVQLSPGENLITLNVQPGCNSSDLLFIPPYHEEASPDQSQHFTTSHTGGNHLQCGKMFAKSSGLFIHKRTCTDEKPYSCSESGKCFPKKSKLVSHDRIHTGEMPYSCSECGKCFLKKSNFVSHERIHTGEKPFSCSKCGKCFTNKTNLVTHERIHTEEKSFSCSVCGKCFKLKSCLVRHYRTHTGEKPFSCSVCGKCFAQRSVLVRHHRTHTGEKPFSCSECGKCFTQKPNFVMHQIIHTRVKSF